jgi:hypothetical protein
LPNPAGRDARSRGGAAFWVIVMPVSVRRRVPPLLRRGSARMQRRADSSRGESAGRDTGLPYPRMP